MKVIQQLLITTAITILTTTGHAQNITGPWKGSVSFQGTEVEMVFNIYQTADTLYSTLDVPLQGVSDYALDQTTVVNNQLKISSARLQMEYSGSIDEENIMGVYKQAGMEFSLQLRKTVKTLPGDTSLPSTPTELKKIAESETGNFKYSVEDYFQNPNAYGFQLSPNGEYLSYLKRNEDGKSTLYIKNSKTEKETPLIKEGKDIIKGYYWATNSRILYLQDKGGNENFHVFGINTDGSNQKKLTPYEGTKVGLLEVLRDDENHIIISMNKDNKQQEEPYLLNINDGTIKKLFSYNEGKSPISGYTFDKNGELRLLTRIVNGIEIEVYYKTAEQMEKLMLVELGNSFQVIDFNYTTEYPHDAYVASNMNSDKILIQLYDLKKNRVIKTIATDETYDVASIRLSQKRGFELDYIVVNAEKVNIIPISKTYKKIYKRLKAEFGEKQFYTTYRSKDENIYMVVVTSDKIVGEYFIYNVKEDSIKKLYKVLPQLKEEDMAEMRPIKFKSRDGITIHGYITLPNAAQKGQKVPLIVMPHGGPQGVRDSWGFIKENQLFASRGYATLNVNFRISGGYGKEFMTSGFKQIGRKVMDDVEDGVTYAIEQGWVQEDKIAIFGASHGGYAVLRGMTKTPNLYACGVDYVGVSNLNTFMESIPAYWEKYRDFLYETWYDPSNPDELKIMNEISPALHTDKIVKPLFVVQGANDPRVNINEADQIVSSLRARNISVPYMVKYDEGHGFHKEENKIELYTTMMGFFAQHLQ